MRNFILAVVILFVFSGIALAQGPFMQPLPTLPQLPQLGPQTSTTFSSRGDAYTTTREGATDYTVGTDGTAYTTVHDGTTSYTFGTDGTAWTTVR